MSKEHVHDCTGPDMRCPCGFVFRAGRFVFSLEVYDNQTNKSVVDDGFNTDQVSTVRSALRDAIERLGHLK